MRTVAKFVILACCAWARQTAWAQVPPPPPLAQENPAPDAHVERPPAPPSVAQPPVGLADRSPLPPWSRADCDNAQTSGNYIAASQCWQSVLVEPLDEARKAQAIALEALLRLDEAAAVWKPWLGQAMGPDRIALQRRINALAEAELALAELTAAKTAAAAQHLQSVATDLTLPDVVKWGPAPAWLAELAGAVRRKAAAAPQPLWTRGLPGSGDEEPVAIAGVADGGAWIAARANLHEQGGYKLRLYRVDASGRLRGQMTWGSGGDDEPQALHAGPELTAVAGRTTRSGRPQGWLVVFDAAKRPLLDESIGQSELLQAVAPATAAKGGKDAGWVVAGLCAGKACELRVDAAGKALAEAGLPKKGKQKGGPTWQLVGGPGAWRATLTGKRAFALPAQARRAAVAAAGKDAWVVTSVATAKGRSELTLSRWR